MHLFSYLFKINDTRTRGPLILSEVHKNTQIYTIRKRTKRKKQTENEIKHKNNTEQHTVQTENYENYFSIKCTAQTMTDIF